MLVFIFTLQLPRFMSPPHFRSLFSFTHTTTISLYPSISFYSLGHHLRVYMTPVPLTQVTPQLKNLHWLPIAYRIKSRPFILTCKTYFIYSAFSSKRLSYVYSNKGLPHEPHIRCVLPASKSLHILSPRPRCPSLPLYL